MRVEYRSDEWVISISQGEANAWLATSLDAWLESLGRPKMTLTPRVAFVPGRVLVGFRDGSSGAGSSDSERGRTYWAEVAPRAEDSGVFVTLQRAGVGRASLSVERLRVLADAVVKKNAADEDRARLDQLLAGNEVRVVGGGFELADGRRVRIVRIDVAANELHLTMVTEKP